VHYAYAKALLEADRIDQAESEFREETRVNPNSPLPWIALSSLALQKQRPNDAMAAAKHAEEAGPDDPAVYATLADAYQALGQSELSKTARVRQTKLSNQSVGVELSQVNRYSVRVEGAKSAASAVNATAAG